MNRRNIYKGLTGRKPAKCDTCGAEFELGHRRLGETCGVGQGGHFARRSITLCEGTLIPIRPSAHP